MRISDWSSDGCSSDLDVYSTAGNGRESISINSSHLANNAATPVFLSVRAYLYAGSSVYVDADWMVQVSEGETQIADYFSCRTGGLLSDTSPGVAHPNRSEELRVGKECVRKCRY